MQLVRNPLAMWGTWVRSLGWEDPLEEGMATHSSILAWRIPRDRGAWGATVHGVAELDTTERLSHTHQVFMPGKFHDWATFTHTHTHDVFLPGKSHRQRSYSPRGCKNLTQPHNHKHKNKKECSINNPYQKNFIFLFGKRHRRKKKHYPSSQIEDNWQKNRVHQPKLA